jgi:hypothetical protein
MTDAKPVWTRCPGCRQRLFNDNIDIEAHRPVCPQLLLRKITNLEKAAEKRDERIELLESAGPIEIPAGVDLDSVADWPDDQPVSVYANDDVAASIGDPNAGEPIEDAADVSDPISAMYQPRNLMS